MATKRVVAYFMHESEANEAAQALSSTQITDSFVVGDIDDTKIPSLQSKGLIVQEEPVEPRRRSLDIPPAFGLLHTEAVRSFMPQAGLESRGLLAAGIDDDVPAPIDYYNVALRGPLVEEWRSQLERIGVTLLEALPLAFSCYKARLASTQISQIKLLPFVSDVKWIEPSSALVRKTTLAAASAAAVSPSNGLRMLTFDVRLQDPNASPTVQQWLQANNVAISGAAGRKLRIYALENSRVLDDLARLPDVDTVVEYVPPTLYNDCARRLLGVDSAGQAPPIARLTQDGTGQIVAIADTGIDDQHRDFQGRIISKIALGRINDASDPHGHGTHVAGSVLGDGSASNGQVKGVAPKAKLVFQSLLDANGTLGGLPLDLNDLFAEAYAAGARIHNNSWGADTRSAYTFNSEEVDEYVRKQPDMLIVIAAGNGATAANPARTAPGYVDWLSIGSPASSKNALTVGASRSDRSNGPMANLKWGVGWPTRFPQPPIADETVAGDPNCLAAFSARGPCDDRRIKPDVVAPGTDILSTKSRLAPRSAFSGVQSADYAFDGGTSMSAPLVTGCATLVRQYYTDSRQHSPSAALLKATLINSTTWLCGKDSVAPAPGVPNFHQGHGRVNMQMAIPNAAQPGMALEFVDDWQDVTKSFTRTGQRRRFQFVLPASCPELRVCMAYTDAPARGLQNNLNLMVQHFENAVKWIGNEKLPDALTLPDPDNNVETVRVSNAPAGTYYIQVFVGNMLKPPQDFALVVTAVGLPALTEI
jgi:serine protease AprX